ncbi:MAG TPA: MG2 domain-containing protein, partial [Pyrinomonadaceae bacterium]|nr:MG2 domain-containing protein [Pyrinomonadaceae bacterium]
MKRRSLVGVVCLAIGLLLATQITSARYELKVNEAETRFSFSELAPEVSLALENGAAQPLAAAVRVELLDPDNVIKAAAERKVTLKSGRQKVLFTLPFDTRALSPDMESKILWYRLHYRIKSTPASDSQSEGFISLSEITPDLFELNVTGSGIGRGGMRYQARVRAVHPLTRRPASGVAIRGAIKLEDDADNDTKLTSQTITDREGWAQLQFKLPANVTANDMELTVEGARGLLRVKADKSIQVIRQPYLIVSTDKSLYQPGQTVHARILILDQSKRAVPAKVVTIKIEDPDDTVLFNTDVTTSRFGIAAADWPIPERTRLGDYTLKFTTEDDDERDAWVKVSRYDLPNFTVNVKPDRPYYLPGQDATIVVNADYLFGQPVQRGHVRLVRETERSWNYKEQKYETVEGDKYEGDVEADGKFSARVDLTKDHAELRLEDYRRYQDLSYAAYFTDPTTNRTEQRRFNIRLTKEPIHIYVVRPENTYYDSPTLPLRFFLSTSYADGSPAQCNVSIAKKDGPVLANTRTNRYGVASIDQLKFSATGLEDADLDLNFTAHDKTGMVGHHIETYQLKDQPIIRVATNKALLAAGEPISASITSTEQESVVTVEVVRDWSVLHSQLLRLHHGRASIVIPYQPEYKDEITVAAFIARGEEETTVGSHTVLFPRNRDLKLNLQLADKSYKPGELAHVSFRALNPGGRSVESALGVVVLDKAVEERIRTDQEFGQRYGGFNNEFLDLLGYGDSIGPITRKSLDELDLSKPIPPELQLTADALLNQSSHYFPTVFSTDDYQTNPVTVFSSYTKAQLRPLAETLNYAYERTRVYPRDEQTLSTLLASAGVNLHSFPDPWGTNYRPKFLVDHTVDVLFLESAGPDKKFDSDDDFSVERMSWPYFRPIGEAMDAAVRDYHQRTGGFVRDFATLQQELRQRNVDLGTLRDRWGKPYSFQFDVDGATFVIRVTTTAPGEGPTEEFQLWRSSLDYFAEMRAKIDAALFLKFKATSHFPENEAELFAALRLAGIDLGLLRDPWNHPYYFTFARTSFYADRNKIESTPTVAGTLQQRIKVEPITRTVGSIRIRSGGADHLENTGDDFTVGEFSSIVAEQSVSDSQPQAPRQIATLSGSTGAISGTVVDWQGAAISGATVKAKRSGSANEYETKTDENGKYVLRNLPAGQYELRIDASGFRSAAFPEIYLRSSSLFEVNATLEVGAITETVTVTAGKAETLNATSASVSTTVKNSLRYVAPIAAAKQQLFTPRLREYFPETLFWNPELTTDKKGRAQLDFKLADNITTWKMSVIGSTADGEIGTAETEIRSFQPFFADLDPPRVLTEGDRISLPVVLRNYLDRKQTVGVDLQPAKWFSLLDGNHKQVEVPAGDSVKQTFVLQAIASVKNGKQRVTAIGSEMSDAIEKPVTVHPDGEEKADTTSDVFQSSSSLNIALPADVIAN